MRKILILLVSFILVTLLPSSVYAYRGGCHNYVDDHGIYHYDVGCKPFKLTGDPWIDGSTIAIALLLLVILIFLYKKIIGSRINKMLAKDDAYYLKKTKKLN